MPKLFFTIKIGLLSIAINPKYGYSYDDCFSQNKINLQNLELGM